MRFNFKTFSTCLWLGAFLGLSGCSSLMMGKQYVFPKPDEPSATVRLQYTPGTALRLISIGEDRCYAGYTPAPGANNFFDTPVQVGKELVLAYALERGGKFCQVPFSFIPEQGAVYTLQAGSWNQPKQSFLFNQTVNQEYCGVRVIKSQNGIESVEPVQHLRMRPGLCVKFLKTDT